MHSSSANGIDTGSGEKLPVYFEALALREWKLTRAFIAEGKGNVTRTEESRTSVPSLSILSNMVLNVLLAKPLSSRAFSSFSYLVLILSGPK
jgi:hypothetical protein